MILGFGVGGSGRVSTVLRRASLSFNSSVMVLPRNGTKNLTRVIISLCNQFSFALHGKRKKKEGSE